MGSRVYKWVLESYYVGSRVNTWVVEFINGF